jgi:hypothetical protein
VKKEKKNKKVSGTGKPILPLMKTFSSQEEAEKYNMIENLALTDMEKFHLFCRMMRIGKMLSTARIVK